MVLDLLMISNNLDVLMGNGQEISIFSEFKMLCENVHNSIAQTVTCSSPTPAQVKIIHLFIRTQIETPMGPKMGRR